MTVVLAAIFERPDLGAVPAAGWAAIGWLGLVASGLAPLLFFRLVDAWGASPTAVVNYLIPVVGIGLGTMLLGEPLPPAAIAGGVVVIVGVVIASTSWSLKSIAGWSLRLHPAPNR